MKKITLLIILLIIFRSLSAQEVPIFNNIEGEIINLTPFTNTKSISDTLGLYEFFSSFSFYSRIILPGEGGALLLGSISGTCYMLDSVLGTVVGTPSTYLYQGKNINDELAMGYPSNGLNVYGIMWLPSIITGPNSNTPTSDLEFKLYSIDSTSTFFGNTIDCPGTLLDSISHPMSNFTLNSSQPFGNRFYVPFNEPIFTTTDFAVSIDISDCYVNGDTLSIIIGDGGALFFANGIDYVFYKIGDGFSFKGNWRNYGLTLGCGLDDIANAIFAVVGPDTTAVETKFYQGVKMGNVYPNPAVTGTATKVDFELEQAGEVNGYVLDMNGKVIQEINEGCLAVGKHTLNLNSNLPAGSYICSIFTNGRNSSQVFIVK